jgi:Zn-dependent peptidase ImmA (M78 family)
MLDEMPRDEVLTIIDQVVEEILTAARIVEPPVDAIALAQGHLGMVVCLDRKQPQRGRAQRASGQRHIVLRPEPTEERHQWTVAHEIGEHLKSSLLQRLESAPADTGALAGESLANLFAYRLLVPSCWFNGDAREAGYDLPRLKTRYRTASHEVIAWRFLDLPEPSIITIFDNEHVHRRRRSNAFRVTRTLEPIERRCQEYVHYYSRPQVLRESAWTVHGWPIHQADWKREILRSVVDEEG